MPGSTILKYTKISQAFAFCILNLRAVLSRQLSLGVSTTELMTIIWALGWMKGVQSWVVVICSVSVVVLMTLGEGKLGIKNMMMDTLQMHEIKKVAGEVVFFCLPPHTGVDGSEVADGVARRALKGKVDV